MNEPLRHAFLLLPRFSLLALSSATEALAAANELLEDAAHQVATVSLDGSAVRAACGTLLRPTHTLPALQQVECAWVVAELPYPDAERDRHAAAHAWLRAQAQVGAWLGGLGTGAAVLAQAGLLAGHRATLPWALVPQMAAAHPEVVVSSNLFEIDRQRLSCASSTAALEMMIAWLSQLHGTRLTQQLQSHFGLERLRPAGERQRAQVLAPGVVTSAKLAEALALMEANLSEPLPTEEVARLVGVSRRQLERLFKQHLDELPSRYYAELRLTRARRLLQQTSQSILQIGLGCGFASGSHFSNAYRARFGRTPREERGPRAAAWRDQQEAP